MGYILPEIYNSICKLTLQPMPKVFIETGTFKGGIPFRCLEEKIGLKDFDKWYTVELGGEICKIASTRYKMFEKYYSGEMPWPHYKVFHTNEPDDDFVGVGSYFENKLNLFQGDSKEVLQDILLGVDEPCCFWLDAHAGASKYARGEEDVPLFGELECIAHHHIKNHIIAIDDPHLFGTNQKGMCDYTNITLEKITKIIKDINPDYGVDIFKPYGMEMLIAALNLEPQ